jgi:hypothetical protein
MGLVAMVPMIDKAPRFKGLHRVDASGDSDSEFRRRISNEAEMDARDKQGDSDDFFLDRID